MHLNKIDVGKLVSLLRVCKPEDDKNKDITSGERYLLDGILKKWIENGKITVGEIDYDAFDSDDVLSIIKNDRLDGNNTILFRFVETIEKSIPMCNSAKKFF